jgi:hypothetical protein
MEKESLIPVDIFCVHHHIDFSFIDDLQQYGLIEIINIENTMFIQEERMQELERLVRLHYDLDINLEGVEAITYLLQRIHGLQEEVRLLKNRLHLYEEK